MSAVVADTHVIIWYLENPNKLSISAVNALDNAVDQGYPIYLSAISIVEIIYLVEKGKIQRIVLDKILESFQDMESALEIIPLNQKIALLLAQIPRQIVPEMGDRIIAATTLYLNLPLGHLDYLS